MNLPRPIKDTLARRSDDAGLAAVWDGVQRRRQRRARTRRLALVAAPLAFAALVLLVQRVRTLHDVEPLRIADRQPTRVLEARGEPHQLDVSDGSQIVLSPGARLDTVENGGRVFKTRLVRGRAEFEVRPGGRRRWLVMAGGLTVDVLGTHFVVEREPRAVAVRVTRGTVLVRGDRVDGGARRLGVGESLRVDEPRAPDEAAPAPESAGAPDAADEPAADAPEATETVTPDEPATPGPPGPHHVGVLRLSGPDPHLPDAVKQRLRGRSDTSFVARVCVDRRGGVSDVAILQGIVGADEQLAATLRQWRYQPQPVPFCFITQLVFSVQ